MTAYASVVYPNPENLQFDLEYYLNTHMPLVEKQWGPMGLKSWQIIKYDAGLNANAAQFSIQAILEWESAEAIAKATSSEAADAVFGDIPNFTNVSPTFASGCDVGANKL